METYSDFPVSEKFLTPGCTVTETHLVMVAGLTGDHCPLHVDERYPQQTEFGRRIVSGPFMHSMAVGLVFESGSSTAAILTLLDVDGLRYPGHCFIDAAVAVGGTVLNARRISAGTRGPSQSATT